MSDFMKRVLRSFAYVPFGYAVLVIIATSMPIVVKVFLIVICIDGVVYVRGTSRLFALVERQMAVIDGQNAVMMQQCEFISDIVTDRFHIEQGGEHSE